MAKYKYRTVAFFASVVVLTSMAKAEADYTSAYMPVGGGTAQPIGHYQFCQQLPDECRVRSANTDPVRLDDDAWAALQQVNAAVNESIRPATDMDIFGVEELWVYPVVWGDCEDFVLLKRRMLIDRGWPVSSLLITVVLQPNGEGHAVLTVRTDRGDLILDNLNPEIRIWNETAYFYVKRQSERNSGGWVDINDQRQTVAQHAGP